MVSLTKPAAPSIDRAERNIITHYRRTGERVTLELAPKHAYQWPGWEGQPLVMMLLPIEGAA